ncbi:MAG TPA: universal stress protein [Parafilimonas sp.]|jgi:nucleotide-binding universal stress UspA family protein
MKTVVIPIDFSETSFNAARYAVKLLTDHTEVEIILYHTFDKADEEENRIEGLEKLKEELLQNRNANITVLAEHGSFLSELEKLVRHREVDLVVMGITGKSSLAQVFMGSNALKMAESKFCPVMIIPSNAVYGEIKNVLLATDLKNVVSTTPSVPIKKVLETFQARLHIVNVNSEHYIQLSENFAAEREKLSDMFAEFDPEFYFLRLYDVDEAINQFAEDKNIDLIITINKEHSRVHKLFITGHTKKLAYQSTVPVLVVHE